MDIDISLFDYTFTNLIAYCMKILAFEVAPEVTSRLEAIARQANMSVSQAAGIILEVQVDKHVKLENSLRKMVNKAFDEKFNRITEKLLFLWSSSKRKKNVPN